MNFAAMVVTLSEAVILSEAKDLRLP